MLLTRYYVVYQGNTEIQDVNPDKTGMKIMWGPPYERILKVQENE